VNGSDVCSRLEADPVRFPGGIKGLADYVHALGLKLGIYQVSTSIQQISENLRAMA
jgi:alpha-galactosidase